MVAVDKGGHAKEMQSALTLLEIEYSCSVERLLSFISVKGNWKSGIMANLSVDQTLSRAKSHAKKGEFDEAQKLYHSVLQAFPRNGRAQKGLDAVIKLNTPTTLQNPPQELLHRLLGHYQNGQLSDAEKLAVIITQEFPKHQLAWKVLGAVLAATGRKPEAVHANQMAVV